MFEKIKRFFGKIFHDGATKYPDMSSIAKNVENLAVIEKPLETIKNCGGTIERALTLPYINSMWAYELFNRFHWKLTGAVFFPIGPQDAPLAMQLAGHTEARVVYVDSFIVLKKEVVILIVPEITEKTDLYSTVDLVNESGAVLSGIFSVVNKTGGKFLDCNGTKVQIFSLVEAVQ